MFYDYLAEKYGENEPIFVADLHYQDMSMNCIRQQIKRLTDSGKLKRYDTGIYFIPKETIFKSGSQLSRDRVIEKKYLETDGERCGYISGVMFANQIGLTTQVPAVCEVVTNKATSDYREVCLASAVLILRRPCLEITEENYRRLQLLDLLKDVDLYAEVDRAAQKERVMAYMDACSMKVSDLEPYLSHYPDRIYRNMYEMGMIRSVSA